MNISYIYRRKNVVEVSKYCKSTTIKHILTFCTLFWQFKYQSKQTNMI